MPHKDPAERAAYHAKRYGTRDDYFKAYYERNRDEHHKFALELMEHLGGACVECSLDDPRCLQFDHIKARGPGEKKVSALLRGKKEKAWEAVKGGNIQLLCANCHTIKTKRQFEDGEIGVRKKKKNSPD